MDGPQALMSIPVHYCNTVMTLRPKFKIYIFIGIEEHLGNSDSLEDCVATGMFVRDPRLDQIALGFSF